MQNEFEHNCNISNNLSKEYEIPYIDKESTNTTQVENVNLDKNTTDIGTSEDPVYSTDCQINVIEGDQGQNLINEVQEENETEQIDVTSENIPKINAKDRYRTN